MEIKILCERVRQTAYEIHEHLGTGYLEKIYEKALAHRLRKKGLIVELQHPIVVFDADQTVLGEHFIDLWVNNTLLVEIKAVKEISLEHQAQVLGYLKASGLSHGFLINFGSYKFSARIFTWQHLDIPSIRVDPSVKNVLEED